MSKQPEKYGPIAIESARQAGFDDAGVALFYRQIAEESGFDPIAYNRGSGATGIAQIVPRWHPSVDATNPVASLKYASALMFSYVQKYGGWAKALVAYNAGPSRAEGWDGSRGWLHTRGLDETVKYLDDILGPDWTKNQATVPPEEGGEAGTGETPAETSWWERVWGTVKGAIQGISAAPSSAAEGQRIANEAFLNVTGLVIGMSAIAFGLFAAAVRSPAGQAALRVAETAGPEARIATGATRAVAGVPDAASNIARGLAARRARAKVVVARAPKSASATPPPVNRLPMRPFRRPQQAFRMANPSKYRASP